MRSYLNETTRSPQRQSHPMISRLHWKANPRLNNTLQLNFWQILQHIKKPIGGKCGGKDLLVKLRCTSQTVIKFSSLHAIAVY